jgi:uncharacterized linocin/CFP29 family protein
VAENVAVLQGWEGVVGGIAESSSHERLALGDADRYPRAVAEAVERLLASGIGGPYALALGRDEYRSALATTERGALLLEHLRSVVEGPVVWAPGLAGALVVSLRGGDFLFDAGQDVAIGYASHDGDVVRLYLEESFSFRVATPEAAVALAP